MVCSRAALLFEGVPLSLFPIRGLGAFVSGTVGSMDRCGAHTLPRRTLNHQFAHGAQAEALLMMTVGAFLLILLGGGRPYPLLWRALPPKYIYFVRGMGFPLSRTPLLGVFLGNSCFFLLAHGYTCPLNPLAHSRLCFPFGALSSQTWHQWRRILFSCLAGSPWFLRPIIQAGRVKARSPQCDPCPLYLFSVPLPCDILFLVFYTFLWARVWLYPKLNVNYSHIFGLSSLPRTRSVQRGGAPPGCGCAVTFAGILIPALRSHQFSPLGNVIGRFQNVPSIR